jgi:N-acetyl-anhydromuramyl-L-alanine amidase AmpD
MAELIQARNCGPPRPGQRIDLIVIHTVEAPEHVGTARAVAHWFAGPDAPQASAHYCLDAAETISCVPENVVAWAAPGANRNGIHVEHAGYAGQTAIQWDDEYSRAVLLRSAALVADICIRHEIPAVRVTAPQLKFGGARGICGHVDITHALNGGKGHTDPGPHFPWDSYMALVVAALEDYPLDDATRERVMGLVAQTLRSEVEQQDTERAPPPSSGKGVA